MYIYIYIYIYTPTSLFNDLCHPSFSVSRVTAMESTTRNGGAALPIRAGRGARRGDADLIGLVGDDRRDVAALHHVERRRLVQIERDDLGVAVAAAFSAASTLSAGSAQVT